MDANTQAIVEAISHGFNLLACVYIGFQLVFLFFAVVNWLLPGPQK